jgi:Zn-dependent protease
MESAVTATACVTCGTELSPGLLACPGCHRLLHADALKRHRDEATAAEAAADTQGQLRAWRAVAELLPLRSRQREVVERTIAGLSEGVEAAPPPPVPQTGRWRWLAALGPVGLLLWKFKFLMMALAAKGKLLFFGLAKTSTALSMVLSVGVYWTAWGMWFALGLVLSIYIHEMGHVAALRRFGIPSSPPMFVPGVGAFVRLRAPRLSPLEDARIGLAGPIWGLAGTLVAIAGAGLGGGPMWLAVARVAAWINLFNLLPVWQLDGNRGFAALSTMGRWAIVAAFALGWLIAGDGLFALLVLAATVRAMASDAPDRADSVTLLQFAVLVIALSVVLRMVPEGVGLP